MNASIVTAFYLFLLIAFGVVSVAFEGTVKVPYPVLLVAVAYLICAIVLFVLMNMLPEKPRPDRGDLDKG